MKLPDGTTLMHGNLPYDPVKAHEYYLKTRQLKGRKKGSGTYTVNEGGGKVVKLSAQQLAEQQAYAAARVTQLKKNLSDLGVLLREKLKAAKEAEAKANHVPTLAEKAAAAREAAKYRASHKQSISNKAKTAASKAPAKKSPAKKVDTVDSLKKEITSTRANLKNAVAKQRQLATARKNG